MTNNDVLRRVRYIFDYSDSEMIALFKLADYDVDRAKVSTWLKKDDDPEFVDLLDRQLAIFLNGFIIERRGKREGPQPKPEIRLTNNIILRKMKIALELQTEDILMLFKSEGRPISKHELSAFFRKPDHKSYRICKDQYLRTFFTALQKRMKG